MVDAAGEQLESPVPFEQYRSQTAGLALNAFLERHPHPFLVLEVKASEFHTGQFQTLVVAGEDEPETKTDDKQPIAPDPQGYVFPVTKRNANKFANMITIGRAANNDIRLKLESISKFHAYLMHVESSGAWHVVDANSANGTFVNGERLVGDKPRRKVESGDAIQLGRQAKLRFLDARAFYELLHA
jgi:hypothetical protein